MKKVLVSLLMALGLAVTAQANTGGIAWDKAPAKTSDLASLQNGAKIFVNYCLNCHSAAFMRFNRLKDIGLTEQQIKDNFYAVAHDSAVMTKTAIMGALNLYLDFINMFKSLLSLIGDRD